MPELTVKGVKYLSSIEIETKAREVRQRHGLDTIPINPVTLAKKMGIEVKSAEFTRDSIVGMIHKNDEGATIFVKDTDAPYRMRFTVAHELGHFVLHLGENARFVDDEIDMYRVQVPEGAEKSDVARLEIQANQFAASLLMPERQVRQLWADTGKSVKEMARIFKISTQAMAIRIAHLGLE